MTRIYITAAPAAAAAAAAASLFALSLIATHCFYNGEKRETRTILLLRATTPCGRHECHSFFLTDAPVLVSLGRYTATLQRITCRHGATVFVRSVVLLPRCLHIPRNHQTHKTRAYASLVFRVNRVGQRRCSGPASGISSTR